MNESKEETEDVDGESDNVCDKDKEETIGSERAIGQEIENNNNDKSEVENKDESDKEEEDINDEKSNKEMDNGLERVREGDILSIATTADGAYADAEDKDIRIDEMKDVSVNHNNGSEFESIMKRTIIGHLKVPDRDLSGSPSADSSGDDIMKVSNDKERDLANSDNSNSSLSTSNESSNATTTTTSTSSSSNSSSSDDDTSTSASIKVDTSSIGASAGRKRQYDRSIISYPSALEALRMRDARQQQHQNHHLSNRFHLYEDSDDIVNGSFDYYKYTFQRQRLSTVASEDAVDDDDDEDDDSNHERENGSNDSFIEKAMRKRSDHGNGNPTSMSTTTSCNNIANNENSGSSNASSRSGSNNNDDGNGNNSNNIMMMSPSSAYAHHLDTMKGIQNQLSGEFLATDSTYQSSEIDEEMYDMDSFSPNSRSMSLHFIKDLDNPNEDSSDELKKNLSNSVTLQDRKSIIGFKSNFLARQIRKMKSLGRIFEVQNNNHATKSHLSDAAIPRSRSSLTEFTFNEDKGDKAPQRTDTAHSTSPIYMPSKPPPQLQQKLSQHLSQKISQQLQHHQQLQNQQQQQQQQQQQATQSTPSQQQSQQQPLILSSSSSSISASSSSPPPLETGTTLFSPPFRRMSISGKRFSSLSLPAAQTFPSITRPGSSMSLRSLVKFRTGSGEHDPNIDYLLDKQLELVQSSEVIDKIIIGGVQSSGKSTIFSQVNKIMSGKTQFNEEERIIALNEMKCSYLSLVRVLAHSLMDSALVLSSSMDHLPDIEEIGHGTRVRLSSSVTSTPMLSPLSPSSAHFEASEVVKSRAGKIAHELVQIVSDILVHASTELDQNDDDDTDADSLSTQAAQPLIASSVRNLLAILELVPDNANVTESVLPWIEGSGVSSDNIYDWISLTESYDIVLNKDEMNEPTIAELIVCVVNDAGIRSFCLNEYRCGRLHNFSLEFMLDNAAYLLLDIKDDDIFNNELKSAIDTIGGNDRGDNTDEVVVRVHLRHYDARTAMINEKHLELVDLPSDRRKWFSFLSEACKQFLFVVSLDALETVYESIHLFSMIIASPFLKDVARYILVLNKLDCLEQKLQSDEKSVGQIVAAIQRSFKKCYEEFIPEGYGTDNTAPAKAPFVCITISAIDLSSVEGLVKLVGDDITQSPKDT